MKAALSVAAGLPPTTRKDFALRVLNKTEPISHIAVQNQVSRKFLYQQRDKAKQALDGAFAESTEEQAVLFYLPVTKTWLSQLILALVLICHASYRGVVELFRDLFELPISIGTVHNRLKSAATSAAEINRSQDLSAIKVGLQDEIFQGSLPVLGGVDAGSTFCYLLKAASHRDEDTWGFHLLEAQAQGFSPDYTIADAAKGLRAGQKAAMPEIPCHGDIFHIQQQFESLAHSLSRQAQGALLLCLELEQQIVKAKLKNKATHSLRAKLVHAKKRERKLEQLNEDIKTLLQWMSHDVLELAGPPLAVRQELFDFIAAELELREEKDFPKIRALKQSLLNQRDDLLAFAGVLDQKLAELSKRFEVPLQKVRDVCLLQRKQLTSNAYWERWNQLHSEIPGKFHWLMEAVLEALKETPRASSLVENLNSRLRNYFFLRRSLGEPYLELLQFFLNHRCFMRSECEERVGKSPKELMTGKPHPHWLELLGFERFQRA